MAHRTQKTSVLTRLLVYHKDYLLKEVNQQPRGDPALLDPVMEFHGGVGDISHFWENCMKDISVE